MADGEIVTPWGAIAEITRDIWRYVWPEFMRCFKMLFVVILCTIYIVKVTRMDLPQDSWLSLLRYLAAVLLVGAPVSYFVNNHRARKRKQAEVADKNVRIRKKSIRRARLLGLVSDLHKKAEAEAMRHNTPLLRLDNFGKKVGISGLDGGQSLYFEIIGSIPNAKAQNAIAEVWKTDDHPRTKWNSIVTILRGLESKFAL